MDERKRKHRDEGENNCRSDEREIKTRKIMRDKVIINMDERELVKGKREKIIAENER